MTTQKQSLAALRSQAQDLGAIVSIRKNNYGEYDTRIRMNGNRAYVLSYLASEWHDAWATAKLNLDRIEREQRAEGVRRENEYAAQLQTALDQVQTILSFVGCRVEIDAQDTVTMRSPKTGSHSLSMRLGVRPVSDLIAHACGFAEQQTHVRAGAPSQVLSDEPGFYVADRKVEPGDTILDFRGQPWRFVRITRLPEIGKSGKVFMASQSGKNGVYSQEFYPSVFDGVIR